MSEPLSQEMINNHAENLLRQGIPPTVELLSENMEIAPCDELETGLKFWWLSISQRLDGDRRQTDRRKASEDEEPASAITQAVKLIWQDAVAEARSQLTRDNFKTNINAEESSKQLELALRDSQHSYEKLEGQFKVEINRLEEFRNHSKGLEAEITVLKGSLASEISLRKQEEQKCEDVRNELKRALRKHEESKKAFDARLKDEQEYNLEQQSKLEADLRQYRNNLERLRDEAGKKESALTRNIHELQSVVAKKEVKLETLNGQIKSLETELKAVKSDLAKKERELAKLGSKILTETNKNKRLDENSKQMEKELKKLQTRFSQATSEASRREADLRIQVKEKDEELIRVSAAHNSLQKRVFTQEEQLRRLNAKT